MVSESTGLGRVYLVGAGPGDPGLVTLRAVECLQEADLVIYDRLVNKRLLQHAPRAEQVAVADLPGPHVCRHPQVQALMIEAAQQGKTVVRLKGGDPWLFGRGSEEAGTLQEAGIPYEVVPGVTAALAAAACAGIPLTHRDLASGVALITGHECTGKGNQLDWEALARFPGTLAVYMGLARLRDIADALIRHGRAPDTPAAVVHWASTNVQRTVDGDLQNIASRVAAAGIASPALFVVGDVVRLRSALAWFENRPLFGRTVLVTRPQGQAEGLVRPLERLGATVHQLPVLEIGPPPDLGAVDSVIRRLHDYDGVVFTSANGVASFLERILASGKDLRALGQARIAAIGPGTADLLRQYHLTADVVPAEYRSEALAAVLIPQVRGQRVLLARADRGRQLLHDELAKVAAVEQVAVYSQLDRLELGTPIREALGEGRIDIVTLTSSNIARGFLRLLKNEGLEERCRELSLVSISPVTSEAVRELGWEVTAEAKVHTTAGVVEAVVELAGHLSSRSVSRQR